MLTVAETRELVVLMGQIVPHAERVEGRAFRLEDVTLHQHFHSTGDGGGYWSWTASVGSTTGHDCMNQTGALASLLGILGSRQSKT